MKRNLTTRRVGPLLILRQSQNDPTDAEWADCISQLDALLQAMRTDPTKVRVLVYTEGGAPNEKQRTILQKALAQNQVRVAVVTDNTKARITSATVALGNRGQRSFATTEWTRACEYLGLSPEDARAVDTALSSMSGDFA